MLTQVWNGIGDYDFLLTLNEHEMRDLCSFYDVDWAFFSNGPAKHDGDNYYCFISLKRKVFALLPFLSLAFGGMYTNLPMGQATKQVIVEYGSRLRVYNDQCILIRASEYAMENFMFPERN